MAYPSRNLGDILDGVKEDPKHLRNLSNIYKLELEVQKREYGKREDVSHSRILLREGPDILAAYKKDPVTLIDIILNYTVMLSSVAFWKTHFLFMKSQLKIKTSQ